MAFLSSRHAGWAVLSTLAVAAFAWSCAEPDPASEEQAAIEAGDSGESHVPATAPPARTIPTEPNLKVAFIGDTGTGDGFRQVLQLIKREGADLVMVQGDLNYAFLGSAGPWFSVMDRELGTTPYFAAKGNHDVNWRDYGAGLESRLHGWGIPTENGTPSAKNYSLNYKGLAIVMVSDDETSPSRADYIKSRLAADTHAWKICSWHKNMRASNIGPKDDEMGWAAYENCRAYGAIVAQGHSHTYSRSRTLVNDTTQTVDPSCNNPFDLCVGPGRHFFFDSSVGGYDLRPPTTSIASKPYWGASYTSAYGALFLEFNVDGDANKARGYFKTITDAVVDPPASSGRSSFTVTRTP